MLIPYFLDFFNIFLITNQSFLELVDLKELFGLSSCLFVDLFILLF